jgi:SPP1 gp7 family putative phage head morphogenesis protein
MKIFGIEIRRSKARVSGTQEQQSGWQLRPKDGQGAFTKGFAAFVPRKVQADFYEFLRETIPVIDAAIWRLVALDGHIVVKGKNAALVKEIQEWIYNVKVNDIQQGLQAFHQGLSNEAFEQGFGLGEFVTDSKRTDIIGLRVADSKTIKFSREEGKGLRIYQKANGDQQDRELKTENLLYFCVQAENQNPYGTPLFRSCEFVSKALVTIQNATKNVWERFGDPSFSVIYKTSKKDGIDLSERRKAIADELNTALRAKSEGKSADFVRAIDTNSEINIQVLGHDGQVLEMEVPARHMLEQIIAKSGLPAWMLGMHWSTTERLSNAEVEVLLADITTRQAAKMPLFYNLVRTLLLLRAKTWKEGDWWLEWGQVNLHDLVQQAQARFLNAQADMYYLQNAEKAGITLTRDDLSLGKSFGEGIHLFDNPSPQCKCGCGGNKVIHGIKESRPNPWPQMDAIEGGYEARMKQDWEDLRDRVLLICRTPVKAPDDSFTFSSGQRSQILQAMKGMIGIYDLNGEDSPVAWYYGQALSEGFLQAARLIGKDRPILDLIKNREIYDALVSSGFKLVKDNATKAIINKILPEIEAHVIAGSNPLAVADRLQKIFGEQNSNWERLARTEMAMAAERAKLSEWKEWDVQRVEFHTAPDACPICMALAGEYNIDECPVPGRDTHPNDRCSIRPAASESGREHQPQAKGFLPADNIKDAAAWAVEENLADIASYKGSTIDVANAWNQGVYEHLQQFPELRNNFKFIGTTQERQRVHIELRLAELRRQYPNYSESTLISVARKEAGKTPGNVLAYSVNNRLTSGISVNSKFAGNDDLFAATLERSVKSGFHPEGCDKVKSVIDHEIAHQLDALLGVSKSKELQDIAKDVIASGKDIAKELSIYGTYDQYEFVAESWAEYRNNPIPRPVADKVGKLIEKMYTDKYGG